jgi:hypothetical protein
MKRKLLAILAVGLLAGSMAAQAAYNYTTIDYPGAINTGFTGVNDKGDIVGIASFDEFSSIPFVYDAKKNTFTVLPNVPGLQTSAIGINDPGVVVGAATDLTTNNASGTILDKGAYTLFNNPGSSFLTAARGINNPGLVSGYADTDGGNTISGFIYDPKRNSFINFLPSQITIAHGINNQGDVVGSAFFLADEVFPGSPIGNYGFLRRRSGAITLFRVNGGRTRTRGITNSGLIAGDFFDSTTGTTRGFVTSLSDQSGFQSLTIPATDLLDVPGAVTTFPEGISHSGRVVGFWTDAGFNQHGFIATPIK